METVEDIVREMRNVARRSHSANTKWFADRIEAAYQFQLSNGSMCTMECVSLGGEINQYIEQIKSLCKENARLKAALKPVQDAHIPDFSICDTCRDRSECEKNEDSETCEWYDIVKAVRESHKIYNGGAK